MLWVKVCVCIYIYTRIVYIKGFYPTTLAMLIRQDTLQYLNHLYAILLDLKDRIICKYKEKDLPNSSAYFRT